MTTVEEKLRQALEVTASEIPATQVPALSLEPRAGRGPVGGSLGHAAIWVRSRRARWAAAVAATAAVAVVIGLAAAIGGPSHPPSPVLGLRTESPNKPGPGILARLFGPGTTVGLRTAPAVDGGAVPAYYVVVNGWSAEVLATATGNVLATVRSAGGFAAVSGAAGDRNFVLAAVRKTRTELYLLRLNPQAGTARLDALRIAVPTGGSLRFAGLAVSPDSSKIAVAVNDSSIKTNNGARIWVYDLDTGSRREWLWPAEDSGVTEGGLAPPRPGWLSWADDDSTLAFGVIEGVLEAFTSVRLLDTGKPGTDLGKSRAVLSWVQIMGITQPQIETPFLTANGRTIVLGQCEVAGAGEPGCPAMGETQGRFVPETLSIDEYSARTGHRFAIVYQRRYNVPQAQSGNPGPPPSVLWTDPSGTVLIVSTGAPLAGRSAEVGIVRDGTFTPLRAQGTARTGTAAW
jgi:hypothetical protein